MPIDDDEFKDVESGLPTENTAQKSSIKFLLIFLVGGILISFVISQFADTFEGVMGTGRIVPQILITGVVALLLGSLQAWVFRSKIKSRLSIFIFVSLLGGVIGGLVGGHVDPSKLQEMPKLFIVTTASLMFAALVLGVLTPVIRKFLTPPAASPLAPAPSDI